MARRLRLALDQNFPVDLLDAIAEWLPPDVELVHISRIDARLSAVSDRELLIALHQLGYDGLVTNNYKMLNLPDEVAAIIATKAVVVAMEAMGHDPIRATGALLLELPGLVNRLSPNTSNVFLLKYAPRFPREGWFYLQRAAEREGLPPATLWQEVRVSEQELLEPVLEG